MEITERREEGRFVSLLYPSAESYFYHRDRNHLPHISDRVTAELGLSEILDLKNAKLSDFYTSEEEVIRYRQKTLADAVRFPELRETLAAVRPVLDDICGLRALDDGSSESDAYLYSITEIELYVSCLEILANGLSPLADRVESEAFRSLSSFILSLTTSDYYRDLNKKLSDLSARVHEIRSVTVGVNLDAQHRPTSAGVLSVNAEPFKSGKTLDKILRLSFKNDAFTCIAPLSPCDKGDSENRKEALIGAFNGAIEEVYKNSVKGWRAIVDEYVSDNTDFLLRLLPEIEFVTKSAELVEKLGKCPGCSLCVPTVAPKEDKVFRAEALFNPRVALAVDTGMVANDFGFDEKAGLFVLTGPNRGGKSVITVACGAAQALFQLGLYVPAKSATLSVVDGIFTHFPEGADDTIDKGRLGEECKRLREIFDEATEYSLVLLDESLSSTGAYEATYIASEILVAFAVLRCRGIFCTHLHELAAMVGEINERSAAEGGVPVDTLVAAMEQGNRSFRIERKKPDGKSYARDIADKYGLSFDDLMKRVSDARKGGDAE